MVKTLLLKLGNGLTSVPKNRRREGGSNEHPEPPLDVAFLHTPYPAKISVKFLHCCKHLCALHKTVRIYANTMDPDQTASKGAVCSGFILLAIKAITVHKQMGSRRQLSCMAGK